MAFLVTANPLPPCVLFEDEHLLVVNKPPGWNTHAPAPFAGEGIYEWLRHREPRWENLAIIHRLDKETSGVLVFGKSVVANRSLARQFEGREVQKKYLLLTDRPGPTEPLVVESSIVRVGDRYASRPLHAGGERGETRFQFVERDPAGRSLIEVEPVTGRTHQVRVHAAASGFPIMGDSLYGGMPAARVFLNASEINFKHPATGERLVFKALADFTADPHLTLRSAMLDSQSTDSFRVIHGASDGWPGWYVDRLAGCLLSQSAPALTKEQLAELERLSKSLGTKAAYHKYLDRRLSRAPSGDMGPEFLFGEKAPERFICHENGMKYELSFGEGYSAGLFLDQRDNRRRFLVNHIAAGFPVFPGGFKGREVLNTFAYTCGFSVCAAKAGAGVVSLDLSKKNLEWGRRNVLLNGLDPAAHDFIFGDTFDWLRRFGRKGRLFDAVVLDPPTFSRSKGQGTFRAEKDFGKLVAAALPALRPDGVLFASTNAAGLKPEHFLTMIEAAVASAKRKIVQQHYVPQPPDFPITKSEPGYLKTVWLRIG
jgi:23S rRNA (cytosine1962-C5)-methyltransferase